MMSSTLRGARLEDRHEGTIDRAIPQPPIHVEGADNLAGTPPLPCPLHPPGDPLSVIVAALLRCHGGTAAETISDHYTSKIQGTDKCATLLLFTHR